MKRTVFFFLSLFYCIIITAQVLKANIETLENSPAAGKTLSVQQKTTPTESLTGSEKQDKLIANQKAELIELDTDTLPTATDSTAMENIRKVPLHASEAEYDRAKDSRTDTIAQKKKKKSGGIRLEEPPKSMNWLLGGDIRLGKSAILSYDGVLRGIIKEYNLVDGFWLGQSLWLDIKTSKTNSLSIAPSVYFVTARKTLVWELGSEYRYAPLTNGILRINGGNTTEDVQHEKGTNRLFNSSSSLFFGVNVLRLYQKEYFSLENEIDLANGLRLTAGAAFEYRRLPENNIQFHILGKTPRPNYPDEAYRDSFPTHTASTVRLKLEYTPFQKYKIKDGKKRYILPKYPTFALDYKKAFSLTDRSEQASYDRIDLSVRQNLKLSVLDKLNYRVSFGAFLTKQKLFAPDLNYFATSPLFITDKAFDNTFNSLENYTAGNSSWLETQLSWTSYSLLLKRINFLKSFPFNESLQLHTFWNLQNEKPYTETGYSIGYGEYGRIGIFAGFDGLSYWSTGVKLSIPLFSELRKR